MVVLESIEKRKIEEEGGGLFSKNNTNRFHMYVCEYIRKTHHKKKTLQLKGVFSPDEKRTKGCIYKGINILGDIYTPPPPPNPVRFNYSNIEKEKQRRFRIFGAF